MTCSSFKFEIREILYIVESLPNYSPNTKLQFDEFRRIVVWIGLNSGDIGKYIFLKKYLVHKSRSAYITYHLHIHHLLNCILYLDKIHSPSKFREVEQARFFVKKAHLHPDYRYGNMVSILSLSNISLIYLHGTLITLLSVLFY